MDDWSGTGGNTSPGNAFSPPFWLSTEGVHALAPLGIFDRGPEARELTEAPAGANMAFRRGMFKKYGGFRTDLGPRLGHLNAQKCEDSEFGERLLAAGERFYYQPAAVVYHEIPVSRLQKQYFLEWWFEKARSDIRAFGIPANGKWCVLGIPLILFRRLAVWLVLSTVSMKPAKRFLSKLNVWKNAGWIIESYQVSREAKRKEKRGA